VTRGSPRHAQSPSERFFLLLESLSAAVYPPLIGLIEVCNTGTVKVFDELGTSRLALGPAWQRVAFMSGPLGNAAMVLGDRHQIFCRTGK
jgi:hypothetical protein